VTVFWDVARVALWILMDAAENPTAFLVTLMTEAVSFSETWVSIYKVTLCYIPKDCHPLIHRHEKSKSHQEV
jgi:hypothetical protein